MKIKKELVILTAIVCVVGMSSLVAMAKNAKSEEKTTGSSNSEKTKEDKTLNSNSSADTSNRGVANAEKTKTNNAGEEKSLKNSIQEEGEATDEKEKGNSEKEATEKKGNSEVSKNLKAVAVEEEAIAEDLEELADAQEETGEKINASVEKIQEQNKTKAFLFGTDYKNLGQLRSEMVQNRNQIRQLTQLIEQAETEEGKLALQEQLELMVQEREQINSLITDNEQSFSLFGWAFRLINGYENGAVDDEEEVELKAEVGEALADDAEEVDDVETEEIEVESVVQ